MAPALTGSLHNLVHGNQLKWIFVGGKGGVGKTTTACSLAVALSSTRRNVLLISTDPAHNLSDAFSQKFSNKPTKVNGFANLDALEVEPADQQNVPTPAIEGGAGDLAQLMGGSGPMAGLMGDIGKAIPGIDEALAFGSLMQSVRDMEYDVVVFDTAPTGHTMRLLGFPAMLQKGLAIFRGLVDRFGPMANTAFQAMNIPGMDMNLDDLVAKLEDMSDTTKAVSATFADPKKSTFVCVCIPEFLSVFETERLVQEVGKHGLRVNNIVVNQVIRSADIADKAKAEHLYKARLGMQTKYLEQIAELYGEDFHITPMPLLSGEVRGKDRLKEYSDLLVVEKGEYLNGMEGMNDIGEYDGHLKNVVDSDELRWIFVGGKGGVGKTTTSSGIGVALEKKGKKVLLVSTDPAHNLSDAFAQKISSGTDPTKIVAYRNLYALEVDASEAAQGMFSKLAESAQSLGGTGGSDILPMDTLRQLISSVPGIDEAVSFSQIAKLAKSLEFDAVVFDTAPTGHTLRLLDFPNVADKTLAKFDEFRQSLAPMMAMMTGGDQDAEAQVRQLAEALDSLRKGLQEVTKILNDQDMTTFVCVAIAEFLSVYETERLVQELCTMNINVRNVLVNQLMPPKEKDVEGMLKTRSEMQRKYLNQIDELYPRDEFHVTYMPLLPMEVRGVDALRKYGDLAVSGGAS